MGKGPFWEGIEQYLIKEEEVPVLTPPSKISNEFSMALKELSASTEPASKKQQEPSSQPPPHSQNQGSSDDVEHLRMKYIVGKVAGKDLYDHRGREIIRKDMVITEAVVRQADQEGKLAELIVNMLIPDFGA